ncbi:MAG TPA: ROK family protein [Ktedonobacterales bacterium]
MAAREPTSPQTYGRSIGIEIADGATRLTALLGSKPFARRWHTRLPAPPSPEEAVSHIHELIERAVRETSENGSSASTPSPTITAIGVALWGNVDATHGIVRELRPLTGWQGFPLAAALRQHWHVPITIASATTAAALAEAKQSAHADTETLLYVHLGHTISTACTRDASIIMGAHTSEGMLAHMFVIPDGPRCSCGVRGHLEPIASAQAIVRTMIGLAADSEDSTAAMLRISQGRAEAMSAAQVVQLAISGDPTAARVVGDAVDALALALANTVALLAPNSIVIGGPLTEAGDAFLTPVRERLDSLCRPFTTPPSLHLSMLEPFSALLGAQLLPQSWHNI